MRVQNGPQDADFVQWISSLPFDASVQGIIALPNFIQQPSTISDLIKSIYPPTLLRLSLTDPSVFRRRALLTTLNATVTELNTEILTSYPSTERCYLSIDSADVNEDSEGIDELPAELLQSLDLPSLPLSQLRVKIGSPVMLLRNLNPPAGLCNGSRMVVSSLRTYCIEVRLLGGDYNNQLRTIPRILLQSSTTQLSFTLTRKQFPIRLAFAMTINKSQGQSLDEVGVDLRAPVFAHGQFYVAMTRVSSCLGLRVLLPRGLQTTDNIVWPEVLQPLGN